MTSIRSFFLLLILTVPSSLGCDDNLSLCDDGDAACDPEAAAQVAPSTVVREADGLSPPIDASSDCAYPYATSTVRRIGNRVLVAGLDRWLLFDVPSRRVVASGPISSQAFDIYGVAVIGVDLAGSRMLVPSVFQRNGRTEQQGLLMLDARDGSWVATVAQDGTMTQAGLSLDGSYAWAANKGSLVAWSSTGRLITQRQGYYEGAELFAAPDGLRVQAMPHSEVVKPSDGSVRVTSGNPTDLNGTSKIKQRWFEDGTLLSEVAGYPTVLYFSTPDGKRVRQIGPLPDLFIQFISGYGAYYVANMSGIPGLYTLDGQRDPDGTPVPLRRFDAKDRIMSSRRGSLLVLQAKSQPALIDLHGAEHTVTSLPLPSAVTAFAGDDAGRWAIVANGEIYASDDQANGPFHKLGCRSP